MPRFRTYKDRDKQPVIIQDGKFIGVNQRLDPSLLQEGWVSDAVNCRFTRGIIETRLGFQFPVWANKAQSVTGTVTRSAQVATFATTGAVAHGYYSGQTVSINGFTGVQYNGAFIITSVTASTFSYVVTGSPATPDPAPTGISIGQGTVSWGTIYGVGVFSDPSTLREYLIVATALGVYYTSPNNVPYLIPLPSGVTITDKVTFTQAFDRLIMHRGKDRTALQLLSISASWTEVGQSIQDNVNDGTATIPQANRSLFFQNRLFIPFGNDEIAVSDFNDYTRYQPTFQEFRINQGSADSLVNIAKFSETSIAAFKDHSVYMINNIYGNLAAIQLDQLTDKFGLIAPKSIAQVGNDLWFLSELGVMSITQTPFPNKILTPPTPISEAMQPTIDRINWQYAPNAVAAYWNNRYYLAVPLDDAELLGNEIMLGSITADIATPTPFTVISGATYRWVRGANDDILQNGATAITVSTTFVAAGSSVTITPDTNSPFTGSLKQVIASGVNNAIMVYDSMNQAWSGYDTANGFTIQDFVEAKYANKQRLFAVGNDGFIRLYEEQFEDSLATPYLDLTTTNQAQVGNTVQVNQGTLVTANSTPQSGTIWNIGGSIPAAASGLFTVKVGAAWTGGYDQASATPWTAPNTAPFQITNGVRFYSTNGIIPTIVTTGTWPTVLTVTTQQIQSNFTTRSYNNPTVDVEEYAWVGMDLQTWNPNYSIDVITGENETFNKISSRTKSRTKWYAPFDKSDFVTTNVDGLSQDKFRQDYSILLGNGTAPGEALTYSFAATTGGCRTDIHQDIRETTKILTRAAGAQIKLTNTSGRFRCLGIYMESTAEPSRSTVEA